MYAVIRLILAAAVSLALTAVLRRSKLKSKRLITVAALCLTLLFRSAIC